MELELYLSKEDKTYSQLVNSIILQVFILIIILIIFFLFFDISVLLLLLFILLSFPTILAVNYLLILYREDLRQKKIDNTLSDFLLQTSLFPKNSDIHQIFKFIENQNYPYLSKEFAIVSSQINKGVSVEQSLNNMLVRNKSILLKRVVNLLIIGYNSGRDLSQIFGRLSQDFLRSQSIERDKYSGLAIQKYTLILSASILVPVILSWVLGVVNSFDLSAFFNSGFLETDLNLVKYAVYSIKIYIFEFCLISSIFIAIIDSNWKRFILYFLVMTPLAYLVFFIA